jgi:oligopeptide transport system permease protein
MLSFIIKRLLYFVPVLLITVTLAFFLVRLAPGGPFDGEKFFTAEQRRQIEAYYHLDQPLYVQYFRYVKNLARGDLGPSYNSPLSVNERIAYHIPKSLELGCWAILVALSVGLSAGLLAASKPNSWRDHAPMTFAMAGICIPNFVLGPLLVLVFSLMLGWLPVAGWDSPACRILPAITMGAAYAAFIARLCRGGMMEVMVQDFIRTARAKGLSETRIVLRHALRGGIQPVVSFMGPALAGLLAGSFVVETIFQIPGLGKEFIQSALDRNYPMLMGTIIIFAVFILTFNLLVDIAQAWLDPRVRQH